MLFRCFDVYPRAEDFRRAEIKRVYRHIEDISSSDGIKELFQAIFNHHLKFSARISGIGPIMHECVVLGVKDDTVDISARFPNKCRMIGLDFGEVELVEVVCNREIVSEEDLVLTGMSTPAFSARDLTASGKSTLSYFMRKLKTFPPAPHPKQ